MVRASFTAISLVLWLKDFDKKLKNFHKKLKDFAKNFMIRLLLVGDNCWKMAQKKSAYTVVI